MLACPVKGAAGRQRIGRGFSEGSRKLDPVTAAVAFGVIARVLPFNGVAGIAFRPITFSTLMPTSMDCQSVA